MFTIPNLLPTDWKQTLSSLLPNRTQTKAFFTLLLLGTASAHATPTNPRKIHLPLTALDNPSTQGTAAIARRRFIFGIEDEHTPTHPRAIYTPPALKKTDFNFLLSELNLEAQNAIAETNTAYDFLNILEALLTKKTRPKDINFEDPKLSQLFDVLYKKGLFKEDAINITVILIEIYESYVTLGGFHNIHKQRSLLIGRLMNSVCTLPREESYSATIAALEEYHKNAARFIDPHLQWEGGEKIASMLKTPGEYGEFAKYVLDSVYNHLEIADSWARGQGLKRSDNYDTQKDSMIRGMNRNLAEIEKTKESTNVVTPVSASVYTQTTLSLLDISLETINDLIIFYKSKNDNIVVEKLKSLKSTIKEIAQNVFADAYRRCENKDKAKNIFQNEIFRYSKKVKDILSSIDKLKFVIGELMRQSAHQPVRAPEKKQAQPKPTPKSNDPEPSFIFEIDPETYLTSIFVLGSLLYLAMQYFDGKLIDDSLQPASIGLASIKNEKKFISSLLSQFENDIQEEIKLHYHKSFTNYLSTTGIHLENKYAIPLSRINFASTNNYFKNLFTDSSNLPHRIKPFCVKALLSPIHNCINKVMTTNPLMDKEVIVEKTMTALRKNKTASHLLTTLLFTDYLATHSESLESIVQQYLTAKNREKRNFTSPSSDSLSAPTTIISKELTIEERLANIRKFASDGLSSSFHLSVKEFVERISEAAKLDLSDPKVIKHFTSRELVLQNVEKLCANEITKALTTKISQLVESNLSLSLETLRPIIIRTLKQQDNLQIVMESTLFKTYLSVNNLTLEKFIENTVILEFCILFEQKVGNIITNQNNPDIDKLLLLVEKRLEKSHLPLLTSPLLTEHLRHANICRQNYIRSIIRETKK